MVDDDDAARDGLAALLEIEAFDVECYASASEFLAGYRRSARGCLVLGMRMPGMAGLELQTELERRGIRLPIVFLTAHGDIATTVRAIKAGAVDFLSKPVDGARLLQAVRAGIAQGAQAGYFQATGQAVT